MAPSVRAVAAYGAGATRPRGSSACGGVLLQEATLAAARAFGVAEMPQGRNWLRLPDGLAVEFLQARPASAVAKALELKWRDE